MTRPAPRPEPGNTPRPDDGNAPRPEPGGGQGLRFVEGGQFNGAQCYVVSRIDGLNIRERPSRDSRSTGRLNRGQSISAKCDARRGDFYDTCGARGPWWVPVWYKGVVNYVAWACVDWRTARDDGPGFTGSS